jgi:hypothetical protein
MKRIDEIREASINPDIKDVQKSVIYSLGFIEGAQWADKSMIEKVCDWLVENAKNYMMQGEGHYWYDSVKLKHAIKKVMKEEK